MSGRSEVLVRVPAKINLALLVSQPRPDGYHDVETVYHAISVYDDLTASLDDDISVATIGSQADQVPQGADNLAVRAAVLLAEHTGAADGVRMRVRKRIPVAGGMAGGSADAAAALVACDRLWRTGLTRAALLELAAEIGSDVPFCLMGGTAVGTGRGEHLTPALARGTFHWVIALADEGLSTPAVYAECDRLRAGRAVPTPRIPAAMMQALRSGDAVALGAAMTNDLQPAAVNLMPDLARTLEVGIGDGALGAVISGSGPSVAFLVASTEAALDLSIGLTAAGVCRDVLRATGPVPGARAVEARWST